MLKLQLEIENKPRLVPEPLYHNLVLAYFTNVQVEEYEVATIDEMGNPNTNEYAGQKVSRLIFTMNSLILNNSTDKNERETKESFGVPTTVTKEGTPVDNFTVLKRVTDDFGKIIHIHNVFRRHANSAPLNVEKLNMFNPFASIAERVAQLKEIFDYILSCFNEINPTTNLKIYEKVPVCMALIPGGINRTQYVYPKYVGTGFVEIFKSLTHKPLIQVPVNVDMTLGSKDKDTKGNKKPEVSDYTSGIKFED